jgi:hypothetical protein
MPPLASVFRARAQEAARLAEIGEVARAEAKRGSMTRRELHPARLELLYEIAYLKVFVSWESFLEQVLIRYLCGYDSNVGKVRLRSGEQFRPNLDAAEKAVLGDRRYILWHNPQRVVDLACLSQFAGLATAKPFRISRGV